MVETDTATEDEPWPWELDFDWGEFLTRWFEAIDARDTATLLRFSCIDIVSERCGHARLQNAREGLIELLDGVWQDAPGGTRHEWDAVVLLEWDAVVEWSRYELAVPGDGDHPGTSAMPAAAAASTAAATPAATAAATTATARRVEGISFLRVRPGMGMADLYRWHESAPK